MPGSSAETTEANRVLKTYTPAPLPGVIGMFAAFYFYPPLDRNVIAAVGVFLFLVPNLLYSVFWALRQLLSTVALLKALYIATGIVLATFAVLLIVNGALDRYPSVEVRTRILSVSTRQGRFGDITYTLVLAPWRAGGAEETLEGDSATFSKFQTGEPVGIIVHRGVFRLPWFSSVEPYPPQ